ncbi:uncharacterized protein LOC128223281 [Mya arenaria]|uniref:uncharacterized protein LOC128223281 n=1 Tax=Mya arenaria TaxID=6604 RepID=UPI0022E46EC3|nr:uncharacterized protein LOC128223281 [Mya arenaria]
MESLFTKGWFNKCEHEWAKSLTDVPDLDSEKLKHYLIESRDKSFDRDSVRAYKSLKAFKYFEEGFVQKLLYAKFLDGEKELYLISSRVLASYQGKSYQTYVALDRLTTIPVGGACECVAGLDEACRHIGAVLFAVEDFVAKGLNKLSCTDEICKWNAPSRQNVEPTSIHNIRIVKQEHGKVLKARETFDCSGYDPRNPDDRVVDVDRKKTLTEILKRHNSTCNFLRYADATNTLTQKSEVSIDNSEDIPLINCCPPSLDEINTACSIFKNKLCVSDEERHKLERQTIGQSDSKKWKDARRYRLTTSNFHIIFRRKAKTSPKATVDSLLYKQTKQTSAMAFGLQQEDLAAKRYCKKTGAKVVKKGLVVDSEYPYLGASVDRVNVSENKIVEIKNPSSTWGMTMAEAAKKLKCLKHNENDDIVLNPSHEYYTQIQGQMGILGIPKCDFVICTKEDILIHEVTFDCIFWEDCKRKFVTFYENIMVPEVVFPK